MRINGYFYKKIMRKLVFLLTLFFAGRSIAQDCKNMYFLQGGKTVEMTIYGKKGNLNGKQVYTITNVTGTPSGVSSTVNSEMFDKTGKTIAKATNNIVCNKGALMMDMKMFIPAQQVEQMKTADASASTSYLEYPADMKPGDKLKDGEFNMDYSANGIASNISVNMTERSVLAKENVSSPAGSWDAYKITYKSRIRMKVAGIGIPVNMDVTEWYVPDFGVVKTESRSGTTLITAIK
jgi:hypothetical protein